MSTATIPDGPAADPRVRPIPWPDFRAEVMSLYVPGSCAAQTRRGMAQMLDLVGAVGDDAGAPMVATTADLTVRLVSRIVATRPAGWSPHTTRSMLRRLGVACNLAVRSGYLRVSPFSIRPVGKWAPWAPPAGKRHLSRAELAAILGHLKAEAEDGRVGWKQWKARRIHAMAATAAMTGLRAGELFRLHVEDVDLAARIVHVRPRAGRLKTLRSAAPVPMPAALVPILEGWLAHRLDPPVFPPAAEVPWLWPASRGKSPWTAGPRGAKPLDVLSAAGRRAGIERVTWQCLRRSLATHLEAHGLGPAMIARILRHSERVDEQWYRQADAENLGRAVEGFEL